MAVLRWPQIVKTQRLSAGPIALVRAAIGGRRQVAGKLRRLRRTLQLWADSGEIDRRLRTLEQKGSVERRPSRLQLVFGAVDMLRFVIVPAARDYYEARGISFAFHQVLRFLDDPVSVVDPTGFLSDQDTIIGHVMQVVHLNPVYDLQLLEMFPDGLAELELQIEAMIAGTHPRAATIGAIVEDPDYHRRLLAYVRRWRNDRTTPDLVREEQTLRRDPNYAAAESTFASVPGFVEYCCRLPSDAPALLLRYARTRLFPLEMARQQVA
jgi:hypothetical protein